MQSVVETLLFYHPAAVVDFSAHPCRARALLRRLGGRVVWRPADLHASPGIARGAASSSWLLAPSAQDGSLLDRVRRLLGVPPRAEKRAGGLAGTVALATVALLGFTLFLAPAASQVRAGVDDGDAIVGTVVTADGKPVADADVWLAAWGYPWNRAVTLGQVSDR